MPESSLQFVGLSIVIEAACHQRIQLWVNLREGYQNVVKPVHAGRDALLDINNNCTCLQYMDGMKDLHETGFRCNVVWRIRNVS